MANNKKNINEEELIKYFSKKDNMISVKVNKELLEKVKKKLKKDENFSSLTDLITYLFIKYLQEWKLEYLFEIFKYTTLILLTIGITSTFTEKLN